MARPADVIWVLAEAADGPVFIPHTRAEYDRLMAGVDQDAAWQMAAPLDDPDAGEAPDGTLGGCHH